MSAKTHEPDSFVGNPRPVSALEYVNTVIRAYDDAGLVLERAHIYQIRNKLLEELKLPRIRLLQVVNRMSDAASKGEDNVQIPLEDLRLFLQLGKELL